MIRPVGGAVILIAGTQEGDIPRYGNSSHAAPAFSERPVIQGALAETRAAGIGRVAVISSWGRGPRENGSASGCRTRIELRSRKAELEAVRAAESVPLSVVIIRLRCSRSIGHAVWSARHALGGEPFAVLAADDLTPHGAPCLVQMLEVYRQTGGNIVAMTDIPEEGEPPRAIPGLSRHLSRVANVRGPIGNPAAVQKAPRQVTAGRYILQPEIIEALEEQRAGGGEIRLTQALARMAAWQPVHFLRLRQTPGGGIPEAGLAGAEPPYTRIAGGGKPPWPAATS